MGGVGRRMGRGPERRPESLTLRAPLDLLPSLGQCLTPERGAGRAPPRAQLGELTHVARLAQGAFISSLDASWRYYGDYPHYYP